MRGLVFAIGLFLTAVVSAPIRSTDALPATGSGQLTPEECTRLIRRSLYNLGVGPGSPMGASLMKSCVTGRDHYTRNYYNCVFAATYSDSLECAYKERGIDRGAKDPVLAARELGDTGEYGGEARDMTQAIYKNSDPRKEFDSISRNRYLTERDNILKSLGRVPPADGHVPLHSSHSEIKANGTSYWIVREDFTDVQLVKIIHEDDKGSETVTCGRYGPGNRVDISKGFCAAMLQKYLHVSLVE